MRRTPLVMVAIFAVALLLPLAPLPAGAADAPGTAPSNAPLTIAMPMKGEALTVAQVIAALAAEGVGTYASPTSTTPLVPITGTAVPIHVLKAQAALYANESLTGDGTPGSAVSTLLPMPPPPTGKVYAPFDYLLAAYATSANTPGEILAGKLLGTQNWTHPDTIVFPDLVLVLFSADAVRVALSAPGAPHDLANTLAESPSVIPSGTLCATLADWVSQGFNSVFSALTLGTSTTPVLNFLTGLWNSAVTLAKSAITNVATALTAPVLSVIRLSLGVIGVVSWAVSTLRNLKVTSVATPAFNSFGINPAPATTGTLVITVGGTNGFDWPAAVTDCASQLGLTLPSLNDVVGQTIKWTLTPVNGVPESAWCTGTTSCTLATEDTTKTGTTLASDHTATYAYSTNTESADQAARGTLIKNDYALVKASVSLNTTALTEMVKGMVLGAVPGAVQVVVGPLFDSLTSGVLQQIATLAEPTMFRYIQIEHHQTPGLLAARSCTDFFTTADFPGTDTTLPPTSDGDGSDCLFTNEDLKHPIVAEDALFVLSSPTTADALYQELTGGFSGSPTPGIGDAAYVGQACDQGICGPAGVVRVVNDVFEVSMINVSGASEAELLAKGVMRLCPKCQFPTSPAP